jgi:hypothetical protein
MSDDFDPTAFLGAQVSGANSTQLIPVDPIEYRSMVDDVKFRTGVSEKGSWSILDLFWLVDDPVQKEKTKRDVIRVRQSVFLDFSSPGVLDMSKGKNIQLGRLREAVGQNIDGAPWAPSMLKGAAARIKVKHRPGEGATKGMTFEEVEGVAKLS